MNFVVRTLCTAAVAYGLTYFLSGVHISGFSTAVLFALVLAVLNALLKPVMQFLGFPITVVTFGLFLLVINTLVILLADKLMRGVSINGFWWAMLFSILLSFFSGILTRLFTNEDN